MNSSLQHKKKGLPAFFAYMKKNGTCYLFLLPLVLSVGVFALYPMISSLFYSFTDYTLRTPFQPIHEIGFMNYVKMFTADPQFGKAMRVTVIYTVISVPMTMILSFFVALFLNQKRPGVKVFRMLYYMPVVIPGVVSALLWKRILDPSFGIANALFESLGLGRSDFIWGESSAMTSLISLGIWGIGGTMILWLSAFKNVPEALLESAKIDGAGAVRRLLVITIPMCSPIIFYNLIMALIGALQNFGTFAMLDGTGGTNDSLMFMSIKIYNEGIGALRQGYACALGWVLFLIIAVLVGIIFKSSKWVFYGEDV